MTRAGIGYDVHRFADGRKLVLGGVQIPHECGLEGHSDADALSHAIADAILGAAGLPDIGHHFRTDDPTIKGISSLRILARAAELARDAGGVLVNIDATLIAEAPRVSPHLAAMKEAVGGALGLDPRLVGMGFLGRGEGIAALAVASVDFPDTAGRDNA